MARKSARAVLQITPEQKAMLKELVDQGQHRVAKSSAQKCYLAMLAGRRLRSFSGSSV